MASVDFSTAIERRRRRPALMIWRDAMISQGKSLHLPSNAAGFICAMSDWLLGFPVHCRITPLHQPAIRCLFVGSEVCLKAASPPTSWRRSCHRLTVPANRSVEDLHLRDQRHSWHTVVDGRPSRGRVVPFASRYNTSRPNDRLFRDGSIFTAARYYTRYIPPGMHSGHCIDYDKATSPFGSAPRDAGARNHCPPGSIFDRNTRNVPGGSHGTRPNSRQP
jgi:hypothetical protein